LDIAESLHLPGVLSQALNTKSVILGRTGHTEECLALVVHALKIALDNELHVAALRAYINLSATLSEQQERVEEAMAYAMEGLTLARKVGISWQEWGLLAHLSFHAMRLGRWDEALSWASEIPSPEDVPSAAFPTVWVLPVPIMIAARRGEIERAESLHDARLALPQALNDSQNRADSAYVSAMVRRAAGRFREAMDAALEAVAIKEEAGAMTWSVQWGMVEAMESALAVGDLATLEQLLAEVVSRPGREVTPSLRAETDRMSARLSAARGDLPSAEPRFRSAIQQLRKIGDPFNVAEPLLELAEGLISTGRVAEAQPLLAEARETFERLGARPWLERIESIEAKVPKVASGV